MFPLFEPPVLPDWGQQLANILPLTVLIEFVNVGMKMHTFDLRGSLPLWNWPMTPKGAHYLLFGRDTMYACCLDQADRCRHPLQCVDTYHGNTYPCSASTTTRLCVGSLVHKRVVPNECSSMKRPGQRLQELSVFWISPLAPESGSKKKRLWHWIERHLNRGKLVSLLGWTIWFTLVALTLCSGLFIAFIWLLLMVVTGLLVHVRAGGESRQLKSSGNPARLVLTADNWNANEWWAFYGNSTLVHSLLNRPMRRCSRLEKSKFLRACIWLATLGQWALVIGSCTLQDWNAIVISFWGILCVCCSEIGYRATDSAHDWLKYDCATRLVQVQAAFSSRTAMLGALVYLSPCSDGLEWIDPIIRDNEKRAKWELALKTCFEREKYVEAAMPEQSYVNQWVEESLLMGQKLKSELKALEDAANNPSGVGESKV